MSGFITKDSGERQEFASGMQRDTSEGKLDYTRLLDGPLLEDWVGLLSRGAVKYPDAELGVANWTLADGKAELLRFRQSAFRHFMQWVRGERDEAHHAAVAFNMNGFEFVRQKMVSRGEACEFLGEANRKTLVS